MVRAGDNGEWQAGEGEIIMIRRQFVKDFSEELAAALEKAAEGHKNGVHDNKGSDQFKWALLICIGYECFTNPDYAKYHGIDCDTEKLKTWIKAKAELRSHDGDADYIAVVLGMYNEYMLEEVKIK